MTGTLFVLGIALLAAAFIGGGLKVSHVVEIPVISTKVGGFGLAVVGVIAIALGYQSHSWDQRPAAAPAASSQPPVSPVSSAADSAAPPVPGTTSSSPPPALPAGVFYTGQVDFSDGALDFDLAPPRRVDGSSIEAIGSGDLYTTSSALITIWDQQQTPDKAACKKQLDQKGSKEATGLAEGSVVCVRTPHNHIARLDIQSAGSAGLTAQATVWSD